MLLGRNENVNALHTHTHAHTSSGWLIFNTWGHLHAQLGLDWRTKTHRSSEPVGKRHGTFPYAEPDQTKWYNAADAAAVARVRALIVFSARARLRDLFDMFAHVSDGWWCRDVCVCLCVCRIIMCKCADTRVDWFSVCQYAFFFVLGLELLSCRIFCSALKIAYSS